MNRSKTGVIIVSGICAIAAVLGGCAKNKEAGHAEAKTGADSSSVRVVIADVQQASFEDWGSYSADLRGIDDAYLNAPYQGGRVNSIAAVGTRVTAGQSTCDIDSVKYEAALEAAKAAVEAARGDLDRAKANVEKGSLGSSVLSGANLQYQNARVMLATAQRAYEECRCQAPFDGVVVSRTMEQYQTVAPGMPTVRVARIDRLEAVIAIPESEAFSYSEGMKTEFQLMQSTDRVYEGRLASIDRAVDSRSRMVSARIIVNNPKGDLRPGMVGRTRILRKVYKDVVIIPATALLRLQSGVSVMVSENGIARQRKVAVGPGTTESVVITEGLQAGEKLIVAGAFQVSEGTKLVY